MIKVYHRIEPDFLPVSNPDLKDYIFVADVESNVLETAFELTNNIENNWTENEKVTTELKECRSTSVGDLFFYTPYNAWYVVDRIGFTQSELKGEQYDKSVS